MVRSSINRGLSLARRVAGEVTGFLSPRGSAPWLVRAEDRYGGLVRAVPRRQVSPLDPRTGTQLATGGMQGGDRMGSGSNQHGYAPAYARHLRRFLKSRSRLTIVEIGILRGTGLAIWSDLFPTAQILGLDIDLSHARENWASLEARGAFRARNVGLHEFDQLACTTEDFETLLSGARMDIIIDDGLHSNAAITRTLAAAAPCLSEDFVYFVEDHATIHEAIEQQYPQFRVTSYGQLTVLEPRRA